MSKTHRMVSYLTDEQYRIFNQWCKDSGNTKAEVLRYALRNYMQNLEVITGHVWPEGNPERGGKRMGSGRKSKLLLDK